MTFTNILLLVSLVGFLQLAAAGKTITCKSDDPSQHTLTKSKLSQIVNTVVKETVPEVKGYPFPTYLYVSEGPCKGKMLKSDSKSKHKNVNCEIATCGKNEHHAEMIMLQFNEHECGKPKEFWLSNSPCVHCAEGLMKAYENVYPKPTIYIAHFYIGKLEKGDKKDAKEKEAKEGLAKMVAQGFKFEVWDWELFKENFMDVKDCKEIVQKLQNSNNFKSAQDKVKNVLEEVKKTKKQEL